jgi:hypothetical protein
MILQTIHLQVIIGLTNCMFLTYSNSEHARHAVNGTIVNRKIDGYFEIVNRDSNCGKYEIKVLDVFFRESTPGAMLN